MGRLPCLLFGALARLCRSESLIVATSPRVTTSMCHQIHRNPSKTIATPKPQSHKEKKNNKRKDYFLNESQSNHFYVPPNGHRNPPPKSDKAQKEKKRKK